MGIEVMWRGNCFPLHYLSFDSLRPGREACKVSLGLRTVIPAKYKVNC